MGRLNRPTVVAHDEEELHATSRESSPTRSVGNSKSTSPSRDKKVTDGLGSGVDHVSKKDHGTASTQTDDGRILIHRKHSPFRSRLSPIREEDAALSTNVCVSDTQVDASKPSRSPSGQRRAEKNSAQDRTHLFLEFHNNRIGDAQASPPHEQNTLHGSPIDTAVRRIQETGSVARAKAYQIAGKLLLRIYEKKDEEGAARNGILTKFVHAFEKDLLDNIEEISLEFHLFNILIQEGVMFEHDLFRVAKLLRDRAAHAGCNLLLRLIFNNRQLMLTGDMLQALTYIASDVKQ